mmetsp:Transcript_123432/g.394869  ORF Transcript_123432/g.394869 Transcript_123432/m.394869 type:complete len:206 (+) Transcript_123432:57-674(+)
MSLPRAQLWSVTAAAEVCSRLQQPNIDILSRTELANLLWTSLREALQQAGRSDSLSFGEDEEGRRRVSQRSLAHSKILGIAALPLYCGLYGKNREKLVAEQEYAYGDDVMFGFLDSIGVWSVYDLWVRNDGLVVIADSPCYTWSAPPDSPYDVSKRPWYVQGLAAADATSAEYSDPVTGERIGSVVHRFGDESETVVIAGTWVLD